MADQEMDQQDFTADDNYQSGDFQENGVNNTEGGVESQDGGDGSTGNNQDSGAADAPGRDDDRKLFVGGLSWETTEKELREYFSKYGPIESINVKTDPTTGRSRGFAFLVFNSADTIEKIVAVTEHTINGKKVDPKKAKARHGKIFVGGLKPELSDDEIKNFFSQYGTIVDVEMPFDKQKNQRKGFCFITFEQEAVVTDLLKTPKQTINGHQVDVKKATPKPDQMMMMRGGMMGGRGMRGRGACAAGAEEAGVQAGTRATGAMAAMGTADTGVDMKAGTDITMAMADTGAMEADMAGTTTADTDTPTMALTRRGPRVQRWQEPPGRAPGAAPTVLSVTATTLPQPSITTRLKAATTTRGPRATVHHSTLENR